MTTREISTEKKIFDAAYDVFLLYLKKTGLRKITPV
jgi:hypothetical protein